MDGGFPIKFCHKFFHQFNIFDSINDHIFVLLLKVDNIELLDIDSFRAGVGHSSHVLNSELIVCYSMEKSLPTKWDLVLKLFTIVANQMVQGH